MGEYSAQNLALSQQPASVHTPPSGAARQLSGLSKKSTAGGTPRAAQQMEVQLRATRQDALQLATAVVRLEKEKAALQKQVSGQQIRVSMHTLWRCVLCWGPPSPPPRPLSPI